MPHAIKSGNRGTTVKVDKNERFHTFAVVRTVSEQATQDSIAYNLNSGLVTLTTAGESGIIYFKNNESESFDISSIVVIMGPSTGGSATDTTRVRVYKNPTTGTLISGATAVDINSNRDFGTSDTLSSSLVYKGATGNTITDGSVHIDSLVSPGTRASFAISEVLRKGNSLAVSLEPNDSNTSMKVMVAIVGHLEVSTDNA